MANSCSPTSLSFLLTIIFSIVTSQYCSASSSSSSSSSIASNQLKFWSENVQNKMPNSILKKLSPLSTNDCDYYSKKLSRNGDHEFSTDAHFCSLANLACTSVFGNVKTVKQTYTTVKSYGLASASLKAKENADPFSFFRQSILKKGNLVHLPNLQESLPSRAFLPTQIASKISLTYESIARLFPETAKDTIQTSLSYCNAAAIDGETKSCPKTLEEIVGFAKSALGSKKVVALSSKISKAGLINSDSELLIKNLKKYDAEKIVACHEAFLPFAAYFCHSLPSTHLYEVEFVDPKTGVSVDTMLGICHMDTSAWPKNHVAFQLLKFRPGEGEACHWFSQLDLAWIAI